MNHDDLRKMLRASDPARDRGMSPIERARITAAIAAATPRPSRSMVPLLAMGMVTAAVVVAAMLLVSPSSTTKREHAQIQTPVQALPPRPVVAQVEPPRVAARPLRVRRPQARPAVLDLTPRAPTRIEFTAPEGTRILWFVGSPDAKELGS